MISIRILETKLVRSEENSGFLCMIILFIQY